MKHPYDLHIHYSNPFALMTLSSYLSKIIPFHMKHIVVCSIGSDRCIGDSIGPLVGHRLSQSQQFDYPVYGTLLNPVNALNCDDVIKYINSTYPNAFVIAIDACLGEFQQVGQILVDSSPIHPGLALNKKLQPIGNLSIKAIVNSKSHNPLKQLQNTRLHIVMELSTLIADSLIHAASPQTLEKLQYPNYHAYNHNTWQ